MVWHGMVKYYMVWYGIVWYVMQTILEERQVVLAGYLTDILHVVVMHLREYVILK